MTTTQGKAVCDWLAGHRAEMMALLEEAVNIDSGSSHKPGADRMAGLMASVLQGAGISTHRVPLATHGDCVTAELGGGLGGHVLLLGHMDTVFPVGTANQRPFRINGETAHGPGVADMKAGLVMNAYVARAFAEVGAKAPPIHILFTGDEEVASPASRAITLERAKGARAVFNAEPGRPIWNVVNARKGAFFIDFEVKGVAAHSGVNPYKGASAIEAIAHKVVELQGLNSPDQGISANVGTISGGMTVNTVADYARAQLDVRYPGSVDRAALHAKILEIIQRHAVKNTHAHITNEGIFYPLAPSPESEALLARYQRCASELGMKVEAEFTGGSADSGLTASVGAPTLCATGPVGGDVHTDREWLRVDSLVPRAQALALTILDL
ncbi:Carboxypeptidase G2 [Usitatibacter rugosus]|uniref:Carboxypeptidase G2 n=1 Tax=Usitatibacter rugosus TaxID=2732067 RepID=A0A6M4GYH9_9PROT|nr:M20 family metallopeptidase [Usitatibacter rugosus]QJR12085.1 Carboxypeptidase G2 [Usitatibacter rugosus]